MNTISQPRATTSTVSQRKQVNEWLARNNIKINADGKSVNLVKLVAADLKSTNYNRETGNRLAYDIGKTTVAEDYAPTAECGRGLHFSATKKQAVSAGGQGPESIVCSVDLESMVVINGDKVKARSCFVLGRGDEKDLAKYNPDYIYSMLRAWSS